MQKKQEKDKILQGFPDEIKKINCEISILIDKKIQINKFKTEQDFSGRVLIVYITS